MTRPRANERQVNLAGEGDLIRGIIPPRQNQGWIQGTQSQVLEREIVICTPTRRRNLQNQLHGRITEMDRFQRGLASNGDRVTTLTGKIAGIMS